MIGKQKATIFRADLARFLSERSRVTAATMTNHELTVRLSDAIRSTWGRERSAAKEISRRIGASVGTVKKWISQENSPSGEHLLRLMAESDDVWSAVVELTGRNSALDPVEAATLRAAVEIIQRKVS